MGKVNIFIMMGCEMNELIELDSNYSTTRNVVCQKPVFERGPEDKFETVLFLPEGEGRQGEGGLRTQGYFKKSEPDKPLITIITVVFNGEQFLEETILSVINESHDNVEYIIIDGGSTDGTLDIVRKYEHAIDYWVSEKDAGIYDAMNKGIDLATGEWINLMNGGDCFFQPSVLNDIFSDSVSYDADIIFGNHQVRYPSGRTRLARAGTVEKLWQGSQFCHQSTFTRACYHKQYKFNLCTKIVADFEFFYQAWQRDAKFKYLSLTVCSFEAGGVSDVKRIDSILGRLVVVNKSSKTLFFYIYLILKEQIKSVVKK